MTPDDEPTGPRRLSGFQGGWRSADVLRAAALVLGLLVGVVFVWLVHPLLLTAFLGVLFGLSVARGAAALGRFRIPSGLAATGIVLGFYAVLFGLGAWTAPTLGAQFGELRARLPEAVKRVDQWLEAHQDGMVGKVLAGPTGEPAGAPAVGTETAAAPPTGAPADRPAKSVPGQPAGKSGTARLGESLAHQLGAASHYLFSVVSSTVAVGAGLLLITFIAIYVGAEPELYHRGLLRLVPIRGRKRAEEVLAAIATTLRKWLLAQLLAMLSIGAVTTIVLLLLGVKAALVLGLIAGLLEFIPTVGPLLSAIPAIAMGFLDSPQKALFVAIAYIGIQFLENHVLIPLLMKQGVDLPPVLTILGQAAMAIVFGFLGLLVAVPLIATAVVAIKMLYVEDVIGEPATVPRGSH